MPNIPETVVTMLRDSLGGCLQAQAQIWIEGVVDRFGQSKPKVLVAAAGYPITEKVFLRLKKLKR